MGRLDRVIEREVERCVYLTSCFLCVSAPCGHVNVREAIAWTAASSLVLRSTMLLRHLFFGNLKASPM